MHIVALTARLAGMPRYDRKVMSDAEAGDSAHGGHRGGGGHAEEVRGEEREPDEEEDADARPEREQPRGTISPPIVATTFRPTVQPPSSANAAISPAAPSFESTPLPTAGPNATPVEESPTLNPTNTATATPTSNRRRSINTRNQEGN